MDRANKFLSVDRFVNIKIKKNVIRIVFVVDVKATSTTKTIRVTYFYILILEMISPGPPG